MKTFKTGTNYKVISNEETLHHLPIGTEFIAEKYYISKSGLIYTYPIGAPQKVFITECLQQQPKNVQPTVKLSKLKNIDIDNIKLGCEIELGGEIFYTEIQYILSSNSAHHSDLVFEEKLETMGIDMSEICEGIENRDYIF